MKTILVLGVIISTLGLFGLLICILKGIKIKRFERLGTHDPEKLQNLLGRLYVLNMLSLSSSFLGLLMVVVGIIFVS